MLIQLSSLMLQGGASEAHDWTGVHIRQEVQRG